MLIISKFHDYYDTAIAFGVDKTIVYNRKTETLKKENRWRYRHETKGTKKYSYESDKLTIGFCGEVFPIVKIVRKSTYHGDPTYHGGENFFFYDRAEMMGWIDKEGLEDNSRWGRWEPFTIGDDYFDPKSDRHTRWNYKEIFLKHKVPVFVYEDSCITVNPTLKDYRFAKVKDPFTAFQDIMQYISGVLGVGSPTMVEISNEDMRDKKGFDNWSFRRHPADSKKPRSKK